jgi:hypothetical protein
MSRQEVDLEVLASLEELPADVARLPTRCGCVNVGDVLFEVAVVGIELSALRAGGLGRAILPP